MNDKQKEKLLFKLTPKDSLIIQGVICKVCKTKYYLKDYENKQKLKERLVKHMMKDHTDNELKNHLIDFVKKNE